MILVKNQSEFQGSGCGIYQDEVYTVAPQRPLYLKVNWQIIKFKRINTSYPPSKLILAFVMTYTRYVTLRDSTLLLERYDITFFHGLVMTLQRSISSKYA